MVQSVNTKAILTLASIVRRPGLLVPHLSVANVSEVRTSQQEWCQGCLSGSGYFVMRQSHYALFVSLYSRFLVF
jgi:hypothetical protein